MPVNGKHVHISIIQINCCTVLLKIIQIKIQVKY